MRRRKAKMDAAKKYIIVLEKRVPEKGKDAQQ
jgi:hypothetical protein